MGFLFNLLHLALVALSTPEAETMVALNTPARIVAYERHSVLWVSCAATNGLVCVPKVRNLNQASHLDVSHRLRLGAIAHRLNQASADEKVAVEVTQPQVLVLVNEYPLHAQGPELAPAGEILVEVRAELRTFVRMDCLQVGHLLHVHVVSFERVGLFSVVTRKICGTLGAQEKPAAGGSRAEIKSAVVLDDSNEVPYYSAGSGVSPARLQRARHRPGLAEAYAPDSCQTGNGLRSQILAIEPRGVPTRFDRLTWNTRAGFRSPVTPRSRSSSATY